jgi:hypothetical protein
MDCCFDFQGKTETPDVMYLISSITMSRESVIQEDIRNAHRGLGGSRTLIEVPGDP